MAVNVGLPKKEVKRIRRDVLPNLDDAVEVKLPTPWLTIMAEKQHKESPSSIVNFLACPLKWFIDRHAPIPGIEDINVFNVAGTIAHRILEVYYSEPPQMRSDRLLNEVSSTVWDALDEQNDEDGIVEPDTIREYQIAINNSDRGYSVGRQRTFLKEKVSAAIKNVFKFDEPKDIDVVSNEVWLRMVSNGIRINGKGDRVQRDASGKLIIDDWKSGKVYHSDDDVITVEDTTFLPAGMYALMMMEMANGDLIPPDIRSVRLLYLTPGKEFEVMINDDVLDTVRVIVDGVTELMHQIITDGIIYATPARKPTEDQCGYCPIVSMCPAWTDNKGLKAVRENWGI